MKKHVILLAAIVCMAFGAQATTHTITAGGTSFSPSSLTFHLGDTVKFVWSNGTHTTTSTSVPATAATWDANLNSTTTSFTYVPTVAGTYNYQCNFHVSMGMTGTFTVTVPTNVPMANNSHLFTAYPSPASTSLLITLDDPNQPAALKLMDMTGRTVIQESASGTNAAMDVQHIPDGYYVLTAEQGGKMYKQQVLIVH